MAQDLLCWCFLFFLLFNDGGGGGGGGGAVLMTAGLKQQDDVWMVTDVPACRQLSFVCTLQMD